MVVTIKEIQTYEKMKTEIKMPSDRETKRIVRGLCKKLLDSSIEDWSFEPKNLRHKEDGKLGWDEKRGAYHTEKSEDFAPSPLLNFGVLSLSDRLVCYSVSKTSLGYDSREEGKCAVFGDGGHEVFEHYYQYGLRVELTGEEPMEFEGNLAVKGLYEKTIKKFKAYSRKKSSEERGKRVGNAKKKLRRLLKGVK